MADAVRRAWELIPAAPAVVEEHAAGLSEFGPAPEPTSGVAPYPFFTDLRHLVFTDEGDTTRNADLLEPVEETPDSPDQMVRDASAIRIAHKPYRHQAEITRADVEPGPRLRRATA